MIAIVCLDDDNGMLFNGRRASRDRVLIEHICEKFKDKLIHVSSYSAELFPDRSNISVEDMILKNINDNDVYFVEKEALSPYESRIDQLIVYRWNRRYPSDVKLDIDINKGKWHLVSSADFAGHSHEKITEEIFIRRE